MCKFIITALPHSTDIERIQAIAQQYGFVLYPVDMTLTGLAPGREASVFLTVKGPGCDCGTAIGAGKEHLRPWRPRQKDLEKLQRKGWSSTRISRWIDEKRKTVERGEKKSIEGCQWGGPVAKIQARLALAADAIESGAATRLGIMLVWSPGREIAVEQEIRIKIGEANENQLVEADEGVLYTFER